MESIKISFRESIADGLRRLTIDSWSGACLLVSRNHLAAALKTGELAHPGVYILVGPSNIKPDRNGHPTLVFDLYIGKSDSLDERIALHDKIRSFWSIAFAFYRDGEDELHAGQTGDLEARLIARAREAGNQVDTAKHVKNVATPKPHSSPDQSESTEVFLGHIETVLKALGYNFLSTQTVPDVDVLESTNDPEIRIPENLQRLVKEIRTTCMALPATEFYSTHVPDLRAKVVSAQGSRVFARILFLKHAVRVDLKSHTFSVEADKSLDENQTNEIKDAYSRAQQQLEN
jgi:hypothetical protein